MFLPVNHSASRETFANTSGLTLDEAQAIQSGRLVLRGTPVLTDKADLNWVPVVWDHETTFRPVPDATAPTSDWDFTVGDFPFVSAAPTAPFMFTFPLAVPWFGGMRPGLEAVNPQTLTAECGFVDAIRLLTPEPPPQYMATSSDSNQYLNLEAEVGDVQYFHQDSTHANPWWDDDASNAQGYTLEMAVVPKSGSTRMIVDDGVRRLSLLIKPSGIYREDELLLPFESTAYRATFYKDAYVRNGLTRRDDFIRSFRVGVLGDDFYLLSQSGLAYVGVDQNTSDSTIKELIVGHTSDTEGVLYVEKIKTVLSGVYLDLEDDIVFTRDTDPHTSTTSVLQHGRSVVSFDTAIIKSVEPYTGGTTTVQAQYMNTSNPTWTNMGSPVTISQEYQEINLSSIPVDGDGSDAIRFEITQEAGAADTKPAPIDEIVVLCTFEGAEINLDPEYGSPLGGNVVRILSSGPSFDAADTVFVDGVQVSTSDVDFISTSELNVTWPAGTAGTQVSVEVVTPTSYFSDRGYRFLNIYDRDIDRFELMASIYHGTKSPFQIKNMVPDGDVNLAYLAGQGVEPLAHISLIDLSYLESGNVVGAALQPEMLSTPDISTSDTHLVYTYDNPPSTEEIHVAGSAAGWKSLGVPAPLFYKYLIGRGRFYLTVDEATFDATTIRDSILVHKQDGKPVNLTEYPWDVVINTSDVDGDPLPANTYAVVLLTQRLYLPGETVFVTGTMADRSNGWKTLQSRTEVVNPVPIVLQGAVRQGFAMIPDVDGEYSLEVRT